MITGFLTGEWSKAGTAGQRRQSNEFQRREVGILGFRSEGIRQGDACCADGAKARR
jgi:hypothetical protein